jgi:AmpD protein
MQCQIGSNGWIHDKALHCPSPNWDARPAHAVIELVVIHAISLPRGQYQGDWIERLFLNQIDGTDPLAQALKPLRVSAHFLIRRKGTIIQFVSCQQRAWHAGVSSFCGRAICNDFSIGIELEGTDDTAFSVSQYVGLVRVLNALSRAYPVRYITGHADIAPGRKTDPGPFLDWHLLEDATGLNRK